MNRRQCAIMATGLTAVLAGSAFAWLAGLGSAGMESTRTAPTVDRRVLSLTAAAELAAAPQAAAIANQVVSNAAMTTAAVAATATHKSEVPDEPEAVAAPADSSRAQQADTPPMRVAKASTDDRVIDESKEVNSIEILDECREADVCIDQYLWALYQRTPKEDSIKVDEQRKVTIKKKGKRVTVIRTITKLVDEDFTWKDPAAAKKARMPMMDYVIGGMDRSFKLKLFRALQAANEAGLSPGITSAFRDDYRQSLASGLKAATDKSYHGGSFRGGYGHGVAADVVSVDGETRDQRWASSERLWKWIDAHGETYGIGRPYLDKDPPHVGPIDGKEYAAHHRSLKARHAGPDMKKRDRLAVR